MSQNSADAIRVVRGSSQPRAGSLDEQVSVDLARSFKGCSLGDSGADATIRQGERLAVVEVKTGDPDLPLPSSTSAQLHLLAREAQRNTGKSGVLEILPILVTNYRLTDSDLGDLEAEGIRVVSIPAESHYKTEEFFKQFEKVAGFVPDKLIV